MIYFQSLTQTELAELLKPVSFPKARRSAAPEAAAGEFSSAENQLKAEKKARYRAKQIFHWVYQRTVTDWDQMSDLSKDLRAWLRENVEIYRLPQRVNQQALDGTHKFLWNLADGKTVESVIIPAALQEKENPDRDFDEQPAEKFAGAPVDNKSLSSERWSRLTACISSQVGCAMSCKFCLTGIQGLDRHLQVHEIVGQVHELRRIAPITNIVFMGMGEPLHNLENVAKACKILLDEDGLNFSKRKVTVSTSGLVPAIEALGREVDVSLAISLNASTDEQRSRIMPVNRKWNLEALLGACRDYPLGKHRRITFEYVLLKDFNDSLEDAARVFALLRGIPSKLNLIPFNEHPGSEFKRPSDETVRKFQKYFIDRNVTATVRISRGRDILAACGQLRSVFGTARGTDRHRDWAGSPGPS
ncbi:MAG: 23S rRNA (adenine(2503)-C(2))-methyltransferase RlmN [Oligoflexia bacterium]|nr:23S rRNA (adenine(2503)-C(2))-methyltransferase RlmN [Oligoflexia bacterium]